MFWILEILHHIAARESFETTHLELKSDVVTPKDFARQFGGLANAARWHPVLVIFGANRRGIVGVSPFEVGDWYAAMQAQFEYGHAPGLLYQNFLLFDGKTVAAFVFDTENPPYVIGQGKKGSPREVPWRYGSNTGTAGRYELLSVLLQRARDPEVDILGGYLCVSGAGQLQCQIDTFVAPGAQPQPLVIQNHRIDLVAHDDIGRSVSLPLTTEVGPRNPNASSAKLTDAGVVVPVASRLVFGGFGLPQHVIDPSAPTARVTITVRPVGFEVPVRFEARLVRRHHEKYSVYWEVPA